MMFTTLWTALITPMNQNGKVNFTDLRNIVKLQEDAGNGILVIGSTGEGLALGASEKREIVEFMDDYAPDVPWMIGVGGYQAGEQKKWIDLGNATGADAFLMVNPLYAKPDSEGQFEWFSDLMDQAEKPCMLYNIPSRTGTRLSPDVFRRLSRHPNCRALKEASGSILDFEAFRMAAPDVPIYSGDDALMPYFATAGASGLVSVASNVWPSETKSYVEMCLNGNVESVFPVWKQAVAALFSASNPVPVKSLMHSKNIISTVKVRAPLSTADLSSVEALTEADKEITNWFNQQ
jgi:4-hydroxy-tetrahydrodipicolinate synthase